MPNSHYNPPLQPPISYYHPTLQFMALIMHLVSDYDNTFSISIHPSSCKAIIFAFVLAVLIRTNHLHRRITFV